MAQTTNWFATMQAAQHQRVVTQGNISYSRIPWGSESFWDEESALPDWPCRDCGVSPGQLHVHHCCVEACPLCHEGQRVTCELMGCGA